MKTTETNKAQTQTTETQTQTPETVATFQDLLKDFAALYTESKTAPAVNPYQKGTPERVAWNHAQNVRKDKYQAALFNLSKVIALAVLKKVIDPTRHNAQDVHKDKTTIGGETLTEFWKETASGTETVYYSVTKDGVESFSYGDKKTTVNSGFSPALVSVRRDLFAALETLKKEQNSLVDFDDDYKTPAKGENLGDGLDLPQEASKAILAELDKQYARDPDAPADFERPYTVHALKTKVYIKDPESLAWEDRETTPIQEIYRAVRRAINSSKATQTDPRNPYGYLEEETETPDGETVRVYRRLPRYSDIGGHSTDGDPDAPVLEGCPVSRLTKSPDSTGDAQTVTDSDSILEELNLTKTQRDVIDKRLQGYGDKAIGTAFGRSKQAIAKTKGQIQTKWKNTGRRYPDQTPDGWEWFRQTPDGERTPLEYLTVLEGCGDWVDAPENKTRPAPALYSWEIVGPSPAPVSHDAPSPVPVMTETNAQRYKIVSPSPVVTSPSAFGVMIQNRVVDGCLVGHDGKNPDTWL